MKTIQKNYRAPLLKTLHQNFGGEEIWRFHRTNIIRIGEICWEATGTSALLQTFHQESEKIQRQN